tara:strand:+ start:222 stop:950 length:729 start_codon:yes stop_codon:yes gene_type:complete
METVNINAPGYRMKGSPMQRNFNIGVATETGMSGLVSKDSPMQFAWLAAIGKAVAGAAKAAAGKIAAGATKIAGKVAGKLGAKGLAGKLSKASAKVKAWGAKGKKVPKHTWHETTNALRESGKTNRLAGMMGKVKGGLGEFAKSDIGKQVGTGLGMQTLSSMSQAKEERPVNSPSATFASMKFGTGGSAFAMMGMPWLSDEKKRRKSGTDQYQSSPEIQEFINQNSAIHTPIRNYKKGYYGA